MSDVTILVKECGEISEVNQNVKRNNALISFYHVSYLLLKCCREIRKSKILFNVKNRMAKK